MVTTKCANCDLVFWPPNPFCTNCYSESSIQYIDLPRTGKLVTWTHVQAPPEGFPEEGYMVGIVSLDNHDIKVFGRFSKHYDNLQQNAKIKLNITQLEDYSYFEFELLDQ